MKNYQELIARTVSEHSQEHFGQMLSNSAHEERLAALKDVIINQFLNVLFYECCLSNCSFSLACIFHLSLSLSLSLYIYIYIYIHLSLS